MPVAQSPPVPQRHPEGPQLSARVSQLAQAEPAVPHCVVLLIQAPPAQHPEVQEFASHTHWLLKQRCPVPQTGLVPQRHPPAPQLLATVGLQLVQAAPPLPH